MKPRYRAIIACASRVVWTITFVLLCCEPSLASDLHEAAASGDLNRVKELVSSGIDINEYAPMPSIGSDFPQGTALYVAVAYGNEAVVKFLIDSGADLDAATNEGGCFEVSTPLDTAVWGKHKNIAAMLLKAGASVEGTGHVFHWPLQIAAEMGQTDLMRLMIEHGATINRSGVDGFTALHHAILERQVESVRLLLSSGADPNYKDTEVGESFVTPLQLAHEHRNERIVELLTTYGAK